MDKNLDYYHYREASEGERGVLLALNDFNLDGLNAVEAFIANQSNRQEQWITYNKTTKEIKNISKEEYEKVEKKFNYENQLQNLKKESFTLIECLLYLIVRFKLWKNDMKSKVKSGFNTRHGNGNGFYILQMYNIHQSIIKDDRNNWFEVKCLSTEYKIKNNFVVDLVAEENKKKEKDV